MATLKEFLALLEDSDEIVFSVEWNGRTVEIKKFIDDYGIGSRNCEFFVAGHEFGPRCIIPRCLIHADGFGAAHGAWIDEQPTIPEDELIEAYGIVDDDELLAEYEKANGPCPEYWRGEAWKAWHDGYKAACRKRLQELGEDRDNPPELIEGYEYQDNASGTGIVDVGHYSWMNEIDPADVSFRLKTDEEKAAEKEEKERQASNG
jgi:hypothetical protein